MNMPNFASWNHCRAFRFSGDGWYCAWAAQVSSSTATHTFVFTRNLTGGAEFSQEPPCLRVSVVDFRLATDNWRLGTDLCYSKSAAVPLMTPSRRSAAAPTAWNCVRRCFSAD